MYNSTEIKDYPLLVNGLLKHIDYIKSKEKKISLLDIIMDYSEKNNIDIELIGDAISDDFYFKSFLEKDCEFNKIFKSDIIEDIW